LVYAELLKRGLTLGRQRKDAYVTGLNELGPKPEKQQNLLLYQLTKCALIEARSCERFRLLSEGLEEEALRKFYRRFMESEAGHYRAFLGLAEEYYPRADVKGAWETWLETEAAIFRTLPARGDRIH
jgi:tRNA-(ms[2]io[6]A)-hydroxylase